ncbi:MAG: TlpA family protein disulfide reductase [Bryobacteraceae bacterium]|nr:TlpA family protein disulfide reductase [Bryobacteraceae bacterium]
MRLFTGLFLLATAASAAVVADVRGKLSAGDLTSADATAADFCAAQPGTSECAAALSWLARGAQMLGQPVVALDYVARVRAITAQILTRTKVEDDAFLLTAVGASIETRARAMADRGQRDRAIKLLKEELPNWKPYGIRARIQKTLNVLTLEGQPAPALDPAWQGKPVLLFLWAHWCGDCKAQVAALAQIRAKYNPERLTIVAPTRRYGTVPGVEKPTEAQEDVQIAKVWQESYAALGDTPHPIDDAAMEAYGVTSTPTIVLIDRQGIVRLYRPSRFSAAELEKYISALPSGLRTR